MLLGDGNVHLTYVVEHLDSCTCLHCRQSAADAAIQAMLSRAGLVSCNPQMRTHESGNIIDLILTPRPEMVIASVLDRTVGNSDHWMVYACIPLSCVVTEKTQVGRVGWSKQGWDDALFSVEQSLAALVDITKTLLSMAMLRPRSLGGQLDVSFRRSVLDAAAWARNLLYVIAGHCCAAVFVSAPRTTSAKIDLPPPTAYREYRDFKDAVNVYGTQYINLPFWNMMFLAFLLDREINLFAFELDAPRVCVVFVFCARLGNQPLWFQT